MKRSIAILIASFALIAFPAFIAEAAPSYEAGYKCKILSLVVPTHTMAVVKNDCSLRISPGYFSKVEGELKKGAEVEILQDHSESWYKVESVDIDAVGWLPAKSLNIPEPPAPTLREMSQGELEAFANIMDFPTSSGYFIWTDIARQKTHIFKKTDGFTHIKTFDCSTGKSASPTTRGFFTINGRGSWFYSKRFNSGGMYWVRFNGSYLFHSYQMDKNKKIIDNILGERRSNGCVRLDTKDARWLYDNIQDGTTVFIY